MKSALAVMFSVFIALCGVTALAWLASEFGLISTSYFLPRYEAVRRNTFEQSRAYQEGTIRDLDNLCLEYRRQTADMQKAAIADVIRHRMADVDQGILPLSTRSCLDTAVAQ